MFLLSLESFSLYFFIFLKMKIARPCHQGTKTHIRVTNALTIVQVTKLDMSGLKGKVSLIPMIVEVTLFLLSKGVGVTQANKCHHGQKFYRENSFFSRDSFDVFLCIFIFFSR